MKIYQNLKHAKYFFSLLLIVFAPFYLFTTVLHDDKPSGIAIGCDSYGYVRQMQLFSDNGFISGLKTSFSDNDDAKLLISVASEIDSNSANWSHMIAPHCHHYDTKTNQVILQYPFGTGFALSLFPKGKEVQALSFAMILSMAAFFIFVNLLAFNTRYFLFSSITIYFVIQTLFTHQAASFSIPATLTIIPIISMLIFSLKPNSNKTNIFVAAFLGVLCAFLIEVRVASILILPGVVALSLSRLLNTSKYKALKNVLMPALIGTLTFVVSILPLLYANYLNAGGVFSSTYDANDTNMGVYDKKHLIETLKFYLFTNSTSLLIFSVLLVLLLSFVQRKDASQKNSTNVILFILFLANILVYAVKLVVIEYYLLPIAIFCLCCFLLNLAETHSTTTTAKFNQIKQASFVFGLLIIVGYFSVVVPDEKSVKLEFTVPDEVLSSKSIIYADLTTGTLDYYLGKYAAKITFNSTDSMRKKLLLGVAARGKSQYIVNDSDAMAAFINNIGFENLSKVGVLRASCCLKDYDIYKINDKNIDQWIW